MRLSGFLLLLFFVAGKTLLAQDSSFVRRMQKIGQDAAHRNREVYNRGKISILQREALENAKRLNQTIRIFLKEGVDTTGINGVLEYTRYDIELVKDGIIVNYGSYQTQGNLVVSSAILKQLSKKLDSEKRYLDDYVGNLLGLRVKIDSLQGDSLVYTLSSDSAEIVNYLQKILQVVKELAPVDSSLNRGLISAQALQLKLDLSIFEVRSLQEDLDIYSNKVANGNTNKGFPYLWEKTAFSRPFGEILQLSFLKELMVLNYYLKVNGLPLFFLLVLLGGLFFFFRTLKQRLRQHIPSLEFSGSAPSGRFVIRSPILSAILVTLCIFQFILPDPPFVLYFIIWLISAICLMLIMIKFIPGYWQQFWLVIGSLFILSGIDNLILQVSRTERWFAACLATAGLVYTVMILLSRQNREMKERRNIYFIYFLFLCELISLVLNLTGRYNLAKTFLVSGYSGVVLGFLFLWVVIIVNEGLMLASEVYKHTNRRLFFINFDRVGREVHPVFYVVLVIGWLYLVGQNFYVLNKLYDSLADYVTAQRSVGEYKFSILGLLEFFLILFCSMLLSKLVSIFASEPAGAQKGKEEKKIKMGGYILLLRILIICAGLFIAFAAAGISLNKVTILFGALGVGIGLGLQGLVTNLISGLILSFERPVNVGDLIEIGGKTGTMKSIGFRSSIIASTDGSCIIIPNGELLSQHMVNWTMGHNLKQNSFFLGVAFGSDLEKVKTSIVQILGEDDRILHYPPAEVFIKDFNQGSVDVEVSFWPKHISLSKKVKSDLILQIDTLFKKEGIIIAVPQRELVVHQGQKPEGLPEQGEGEES